MRINSRREGYLLIDHRNSPGVSPEYLRSAGLDPNMAVEGGATLEAATMQCRHCQRTIVRRVERARARHYCSACDGYICDDCELHRKLTLTCTPFTKKLDLANDRLAHGLPIGNIF